MICVYIRLFKNLTPLQHVVIFLTTFAIPISFELLQGLNATGLCPACVNGGELALYFLWYQIAMLVIALSTRADRTRVEARLAQIYTELNDRVNQLGEEHKKEITGIQDRVNDLHNWVSELRQAIEEDLGTKLPGPTDSLRVSARSGDPTVAVGLNAIDPPGRIVRLRLKAKRLGLRIRRMSYRLFWDWDG